MQVPWHSQLPDPPPLGIPTTDRELEAFLAARTAVVEEMVARVTSQNDTPTNVRGQPIETVHEVYQQNPMLEGFRHAAKMRTSREQRRATSLGGHVIQHPWAHLQSPFTVAGLGSPELTPDQVTTEFGQQAQGMHQPMLNVTQHVSRRRFRAMQSAAHRLAEAGIQANRNADDDMETVGCTICLQDFEPGDTIATLACNHEYHQECLDEWHANTLSQSDLTPSCPQCRGNLEVTSTRVIQFEPQTFAISTPPTVHQSPEGSQYGTPSSMNENGFPFLAVFINDAVARWPTIYDC